MMHFVWSPSWMTSLLIFVVKVKFVCQPINNWLRFRRNCYVCPVPSVSRFLTLLPAWAKRTPLSFFVCFIFLLKVAMQRKVRDDAGRILKIMQERSWKCKQEAGRKSTCLDCRILQRRLVFRHWTLMWTGFQTVSCMSYQLYPSRV